MKKYLLLVAIITVVHSALYAQTGAGNEGAGTRWSFGVDGGLPTGVFNRGGTWNFGGSVQADFSLVGKKLYLTANTGFNHFYNDSARKSVQMIPVKVGLKYFFAKHIYLQGETGVSFITNDKKVGANQSATFVYAPQLGYLIPLGGRHYLDAGIRYEHHSNVWRNSGPTFFGLRIAYAIHAR